MTLDGTIGLMNLVAAIIVLVAALVPLIDRYFISAKSGVRVSRTVTLLSWLATADLGIGLVLHLIYRSPLIIPVSFAVAWCTEVVVFALAARMTRQSVFRLVFSSMMLCVILNVLFISKMLELHGGLIDLVGRLTDAVSRLAERQ